MNYFISYDISKNYFRTKTAKLLERHGAVRVQKSVFFIFEVSPAFINSLKNKLFELLDETDKTDSVMLIRVERDWLDSINMIGENNAYEMARKIYHTKFF